MKKERGKTLETLKQKLSEAFITEKQAFKCYIEDRNWKIYKKRLIDDIITRRTRPHKTSFDDVPVVVRADNKDYFDSWLIWVKTRSPEDNGGNALILYQHQPTNENNEWIYLNKSYKKVI